MLNFNPHELEKTLFSALQKSNLHINQVAVMIDTTNNENLLQSIPDEILKQLPDEIREDIRLKRLGIKTDSSSVEKQESMIVIECVRPDGNELRAILKESGKIVLHFLKDNDNDIHYKSICNANTFNEVPLILESQDYIEVCECNNTH